MNKTIDISALKKQIRNQGNPVDKTYDVMETSSLHRILNKEITFFSNPLPDKVKEDFYLELSNLTEAGLDIKTAFELIQNTFTKKKYVAIFEKILESLVTGSSFSAAIASQRYFTKKEFISIKIGEETGRLKNVLKSLSGFYRKKVTQRRQIVSALTYPLIVVATAVLAISFMLNYVVPMFADIFKRFGNDLPWVTKLTVSASHWFQDHFYMIGGLLLVTVVALVTLRDKLVFRKYMSFLLLRIPVLNKFILKVHLVQFTETMGLLTESKVPILQAITLTKEVIRFYPMETALEQIETDILKGQSLHQSLASKKIFPAKVVTFIKVGEEVNQLEEFLKKLTEQFNAELEYQSNIMGKLIEPIIILFLGVVVGFILIAMYLPLFNMGEMLH